MPTVRCCSCGAAPLIDRKCPERATAPNGHYLVEAILIEQSLKTWAIARLVQRGRTLVLAQRLRAIYDT